MLKLLMLAASVLVATAPTVASPTPAPKQFERDGLRVEYRSTVDKAGVLYLTGREQVSGEPFRFVVFRSGWARGRVGDRPVRFFVGKDVRERAMARVARLARAADTSAGN